MFSIEKKSGRFGEKSGKTKLKLYELKTITQDRTMAMRNSFFVLFVRVLDKFSKKKNRDNYKGKSENSDKFQKL
jgi:hypothetical protein